MTEGRRLPVQTNLTNFVQFMDPRADPQSIYVAADVFVMNAACENFARVVLEAMAMHLPVLGTRCGGTAEQVRMQKPHSYPCILYSVQSLQASCLFQLSSITNAPDLPPDPIR